MAKNMIVICEKPTAARSIAKALGEAKVEEFVSPEGVKWYQFSKDGKKHIVVAAVGHIFSLKATKKAKGYPVFDVEWVPTHEASKFGAFSKRYFDLLQDVAKKHGGDSDYIIATDFDTEGEVIGTNVLRLIFGGESAKRMKFSTMTKEELVNSYANAMPKLDKGLAESGLTRHYLDHMWGVSLSRALMAAIKTAGRRFRIMSTGRVQGPTLHMLAKHEKKIKAFKPKPFWQVYAHLKIGKKPAIAVFEEDKIWDKAEADRVLKAAKVKQAKVAGIKSKQMSQNPPKPYDTTSLLSDIYRHFGYSPAQAMALAEALYQQGLISYPRTSSQKLPKDIGYKKIVQNLGKQAAYSKDAKFLLDKGELIPEEGKKEDPAHPAIYPTGETPKNIGANQRRVYDLVVRRFLAVFGEPAKRESRRVQLDLGGRAFFLTGLKTLEPGWTALYGKYAGREEVILPEMAVGDTLPVAKVEQLAKETQPPARYSQGSVLKEMEQRGLGTKATRAQILQTLYNRGYIIGKSIEVTDLGTKLSDVLEKSVPDIVSEKLTRHFEQECEDVQFGKAKRDEVVDEAKAALTKICNQFRKKEKSAGDVLTKAIIESQEKQSRLGTCFKCGGIVRMHRLWHTKKRFAGCSGYPKCDFSAPLPAMGYITALEKTCEQCKTPIIQVQREGARPFRMCLDIRCPTKAEWFDKSKLTSMPGQRPKAAAAKAKETATAVAEE
jgi:DNA topoisomerase-1